MTTIQNNSITKPPYLLGLLCLIPLVGAFVGFGLILYGIIKYRDRWLVLIGVGGILFTILVYSCLFYYMFHGNIPGQQFQGFSKTQLNNVVRDLEFYKIQNGSYPDSLKKLNSADIYDPIQMFNSVGNRTYNYEKIGEKYKLYSTGRDGKPNTNDDFYPDIKINDTTKIGLIPRK